MRIGMILGTRFPPDIRVEKEVSVLQPEHQVFILCPRRGAQVAEEIWHDVQVQRVFSTPMRWWANWRLMATCSSNDWKRVIHDFVMEAKIDVLHVHDLPLLGVTLEVARQLGIPVVADLHENYPQMLSEALHKPVSRGMSVAQIVQRLTVSVDKWRSNEIQTAPQANAIIVVIEEARERLMRLGIASEHIYVVANYSHLADLVDSDESKQGFTSDAPFKVVYAGGFSATRDLYTVIDAVALLSSTEIPNIQVTLMGGNRTEIDALRRHAIRQRVLDRVTLIGWRPMEEVWQQIQSSQVCLVPHVKSPHTDTTIPHKLFQYMACRRPVIVSDCAPLKRIVEETGCGLVYPSGDASALAESMKHLYGAPEMRSHMGEAGYQSVRDKYNWERTGRTLLHIYHQFPKKNLSAEG